MSVRPYIAKITGYDPKYVFRRQFVNGLPPNMDFYNPVHRAMLDNGIYEARDISGDKKFYEIADSGVDEVTWDYVLSTVKPPEPIPPLTKPETLRPYQKEAAEYLLRHKRVLLADDMGLGKTREALSALQLPAIIVCPASMKLEWERQARDYFPQAKIYVCYGQSPVSFDADITIINYDILDYWYAVLMTKEPLTIVADEAHMSKTLYSKRSSALRDLCLNTPSLKYRYFLTGTPMPNGRPVELYNPLLCLGRLPYEYRKYVDYTDRYCAREIGAYGIDVNGSSNEEELSAHLKKFMLRRMKSDVLTELPARAVYHHDIGPIDSDEYREVEQNFFEWFNETHGWDIEGNDAQAMVRYGQLMQAAERAKASSILYRDFFDEYDGRSIVIGYKFDSTLKQLQSYFGDKAVYFHGKMSASDKDESVQLFQNREKQVFIGQIDAMKVGITLTAADTMILLTLPWNPGDFEQVQDRIYRIGQTMPTSTIITRSFPIDNWLWKKIVEKQEINDLVIDSNAVIG